MHTRLEDLPSELFLIILRFLSATDISTSLYHLNSRFDNLLRYFVFSKLRRLDQKSKESIYDPLIFLSFARLLLPVKIFSSNTRKQFIPKEISETRIIGSFSYALNIFEYAYDIDHILQIYPHLECLVMRYCSPRRLDKIKSIHSIRPISQHFVLQHLELYVCKFDVLFPILASCPKLIHLKFQIDDYPSIEIFEQLASNLTMLVPQLHSFHCNYQIITDSQDPTDYRPKNKDNVLRQIQKMHRLFENISCDDDYGFFPHEGGTSWSYNALTFQVNGEDQSLFFY